MDLVPLELHHESCMFWRSFPFDGTSVQLRVPFPLGCMSVIRSAAAALRTVGGRRFPCVCSHSDCGHSSGEDTVRKLARALRAQAPLAKPILDAMMSNYDNWTPPARPGCVAGASSASGDATIPTTAYVGVVTMVLVLLDSRPMGAQFRGALQTTSLDALFLPSSAIVEAGFAAAGVASGEPRVPLSGQPVACRGAGRQRCPETCCWNEVDRGTCAASANMCFGSRPAQIVGMRGVVLLDLLVALTGGSCGNIR